MLLPLWWKMKLFSRNRLLRQSPKLWKSQLKSLPKLPTMLRIMTHLLLKKKSMRLLMNTLRRLWLSKTNLPPKRKRLASPSLLQLILLQPHHHRTASEANVTGVRLEANHHVPTHPDLPRRILPKNPRHPAHGPTSLPVVLPRNRRRHLAVAKRDVVDHQKLNVTVASLLPMPTPKPRLHPKANNPALVIALPPKNLRLLHQAQHPLPLLLPPQLPSHNPTNATRRPQFSFETSPTQPKNQKFVLYSNPMQLPRGARYSV
mmetsp:Transcript_21464/g.46534  ORF Transcript_21464/g.46534 Transcript_21464/m.46534 type:complete len:260 (-) Transcript_21464:583-1362(-)